MSSRIGLRATGLLRSSASSSAGGSASTSSSAAGNAAAAAPPRSWPSTRRAPIDPASFPPRTKPRWQNPPGVAPVAMPSEFPLLASAAKYGHYLGVTALIGLTLYSSYCVGFNYFYIRNRRLEWEAANPEHHAQLVREAEERKQAEKEKAMNKYGAAGAQTQPQQA